MGVFSAVHDQILEKIVVLGQAPQDTTLKYPHAIFFIFFKGEIFGNFVSFGISKSKLPKNKS